MSMIGRKIRPTSETMAPSEEDITLEDVIFGMKCSALAITDDKEDTLKKISRFNPWHVQALKIITGSELEAHKPLSYLAMTYLNLQIDAMIDVTGLTKGGHFLDTQGYIAHNDEVIVLSYRCTTSVFDWLTNLDTTSSEWEIEEDAAQGFSGYCSSLEGRAWCCGNANVKPRVHTGFYNNFLASIPAIKQYIAPLLAEDQPPRKLYVVGHSLGAGIATLAACYFLMEYDWNNMKHSLVSVTAGSPRTCLENMKQVVHEELEKKANRVKMLRIVRNKDVVPTVPPGFMGYHHLGRLVFISEEGAIQLDSMVPERDGDEERVKTAAARQMELADQALVSEKHATDYEKKISMFPKAFKDHMPDFYLIPMRAKKANLFPEEVQDPVTDAAKPKSGQKKKARRGWFHRKQKDGDVKDEKKEKNEKKRSMPHLFRRGKKTASSTVTAVEV